MKICKRKVPIRKNFKRNVPIRKTLIEQFLLGKKGFLFSKLKNRTSHDECFYRSVFEHHVWPCAQILL